MEKNRKERTAFEESVAKLKAKDITPAYKGKNPPFFTPDFVMRTVALIVCTAIFLYAGYTIIQKLYQDRRAGQVMSGIVDAANAESHVSKATASKLAATTPTLFEALGEQKSNTGGETIDEYGEYDAIRFKLVELKAINKDVYGWLRITGMIASTIEYPMVQGSDNNVYLYRDIYGKDSSAGSICVDYRNSKIHEYNYNAVIGGHNMTNGSMFRPIMTWFESPQRNSLANTIKIEVITLDAAFIYELFSAYRSEGSHFVTTSFQNEDVYLKFLKDIYKKSVFKRNVEFDEKSKIVTLYTCTNVVTMPNERYVVHGILKEIIRYT